MHAHTYLWRSMLTHTHTIARARIPRMPFPGIPVLIAHHQEHASGLPMALSHVVPRAHAKRVVISKKLEAEWELNRGDLAVRGSRTCLAVLSFRRPPRTPGHPPLP